MYKTVSVHLHDKYLQLHPLKMVYDQVEHMGYSLALYSFAVTEDSPRLTRSIDSMIPCNEEEDYTGQVLWEWDTRAHLGFNPLRNSPSSPRFAD